MRPQGHLAGGALLGTVLAFQQPSVNAPALVAWSALAANLPDADIIYPMALDFLNIEHGIDSPGHHSWPTHTPLFWAGASLAIAVASKRYGPQWAQPFLQALPPAVALHLTQDAIANSLSLAWPVTKKEYGLRLDGIGQADHMEYLERYKGSKAHRVEQTMAVAAGVAAAWLAWRRR